MSISSSPLVFARVLCGAGEIYIFRANSSCSLEARAKYKEEGNIVYFVFSLLLVLPVLNGSVVGITIHII